MIRFICPSCRTTHTANRAFAGLRARCIQCGARIVIPETDGLATVAPPRDGDPLTETDRAWLGGDPAADPPPESEPAPARSKRVLLVGAAVVVVALGAGAALYFGGGSGKPPAAPRESVAAPADPTTPPPPSESPKPAEQSEQPEQPPAPPAVAPVPHRPVPPPDVRVTAARLQAEFAADPAACDRLLAKKRVEVRGVVVRVTPTAVLLSDGAERGPVTTTCLLEKGAEPPPLSPGQPAAVLGTYDAECRLTDCEVVATTAPADEVLLGRVLLVAGVVDTTGRGDDLDVTPWVTLEPPFTDGLVVLRFRFPAAAEVAIARLRPGERVLIRGTCGGRVGRTVRFENCALVDRAGPDPDPAVMRLPARPVFTAYEADLAAGSRPDPRTEPFPVTVEALLAAFQADQRGASQFYRGRPLLLTGKVQSIRPGSNSVAFDLGRFNASREMVAAFIPSRFRDLPADPPVLTVRCVCSGLQQEGTVIRLDSAEWVPPPPAAPDAVRVTADFLPFPEGRELVYDQLTRGGPKQKDTPAYRFAVRGVGKDTFLVVPLKAGTYPGPGLSTDPPPAPRWVRDLTKGGGPPVQATRYRVANDQVEIGTPRASDPGNPDLIAWDAALKLGLKAGESWSPRSTDGREVVRLVSRFGRDAENRDIVEIVQTTRDPDPSRWEETTRVYARGVGLVRWTVAVKTVTGPAVPLSETRLVEARDERDRPKGP